MRGSGQVWRALERARVMNLDKAGGNPPEAEGGMAISRRRVLAALGGGFAAAALPRWPAYAQPNLKVAIVGGGLAGLSALDTLRAHGVDATLYEARAAVGGRTRSVRGVFAADYAFDEGAQLVNSDHDDMLRLIRRFGIRMVARQGFGPSEEIQIGRSGTAVPEVRLVAALRGIAARIDAAARRVDEGDAAAAADIDRLSVKDYLDRHGLRPGDARDALEATIRTEYGAEPGATSALELIFNLPVVEGRDLNRLGNSDELYLVSGGAAQIAERLAAEHQPRIRLNKYLTELRMTGSGVRLDFSDGSHAEADRVILALPAPLLREILFHLPLLPMESGWREALDEVGLGRNEKLIVGYDSQPWRRRPGFGGAIWAARGFSEIWDAASMAPAPGSGALCYFLGGDQVDAAAQVPSRELAARFTAVARRVIPGLPEPNGRIRRTRWCDDPLTRGAYSSFRPGQLTRFASLLTLEEEGRARASAAGPLLFAGEWLSADWAGFMNGAVQTGRIAAEAALVPAAALAA